MSLGFSLFELIFGHSVCGPLKLLKENWLSENTKSLNLLEWVSKFRSRFRKACELEQQTLKQSQSKMKMLYDRSSQNRVFKSGDKILMLLPVQGNRLQVRYHVPHDKRIPLIELLLKFKSLFPDVPTRTNVLMPDVDVSPVNQHPYHVNRVKLEN